MTILRSDQVRPTSVAVLRRWFVVMLGGLVASMAWVGTPSAPANASTSTSTSTSPDPSSSMATFEPRWDAASTFRNPGMGWMIYAEEFADPLANAAEFWKQVDPYVKEASVLYIRVPWSRLEPTEGHYAWDGDANYQRLVAGARSRGLRLAFRVFVDSQDCHQQATPSFVFDAGADHYAAQSNPKFSNPAVDDPVFRNKFEAFLTAFGTEYDDPSVVDFVDMNTIGHWGEMHSIPGLNAQSWTDTVRWLGTQYRRVFKKVLLAINVNPDPFGYDAIDEQLRAGAITRRDSFGSTKWFDQDDKDAILQRWPDSILVAENCYQGFTTRATACDDDFKPIRAMLERVVDDALQLRANYLDLRHPEDVITWVRDNPDLVERFATRGGYRIGPTRAMVPAVIGAGEGGRAGRSGLQVTWQNTGVSRLANDNPHWAKKFRVAYALLDPDTGKSVQTVSSSVDPGTWVAGETYVDKVDLSSNDVPSGRYELATAIVDETRRGEPAIHLAVTSPVRGGWTVLGEVRVGQPAGSGSGWGLGLGVGAVAIVVVAGALLVLRQRRRTDL